MKGIAGTGPTPIVKKIPVGQGSVAVSWDAPYAEEDNCKPYGFLVPGTDDEGICDPPSGSEFGVGIHLVTCTVRAFPFTIRRFTSGYCLARFLVVLFTRLLM